jgi:alpha-N-arabinofuranosidase
MKFSKLALAPFLLGLGSALTISDQSTNSSSPLLHGLMYESINRCEEGGLYGELLNNRAFQGENRTLESYNGVDGAKLSLVDVPLSDALSTSMKVSGSGFYNEGFFGISVKKGKKYTARFYAKGGSNFKVALKGVSSGDELVSAKAEKAKGSHLFPSESNGFQLYTAELEPEEDAPDVDNGLYVTFDGDEATFNFVSLMPEHFKGRENGLRVDLAETLHDLSGKFLRFPGGSNLEGQTIERRWKWNETVGPLIDRPGRDGDWTYPNTDGIGLHEYFEWCEDMDLTPILARLCRLLARRRRGGWRTTCSRTSTRC